MYTKFEKLQTTDTMFFQTFHCNVPPLPPPTWNHVCLLKEQWLFRLQLVLRSETALKAKNLWTVRVRNGWLQDSWESPITSCNQLLFLSLIHSKVLNKICKWSQADERILWSLTYYLAFFIHEAFTFRLIEQNIAFASEGIGGKKLNKPLNNGLKIVFKKACNSSKNSLLQINAQVWLFQKHEFLVLQFYGFLIQRPVCSIYYDAYHFYHKFCQFEVSQIWSFPHST